MSTYAPRPQKHRDKNLAVTEAQLGTELIDQLAAHGVFVKTQTDVKNIVIVIERRIGKVNLKREVEKLPTTVLPGIALGIQATENSVRAMENEFGFLSSVEVSELLGSKSTRSYASNLRRQGKILGLERLNSFVYPAFQFDPSYGRAKAVIKPLRELAEKLGRSERGVIFWLCSPSSYFDGDRPVDHIDETDRVLEVAAEAWGVEW